MNLLESPREKYNTLSPEEKEIMFPMLEYMNMAKVVD